MPAQTILITGCIITALIASVGFIYSTYTSEKKLRLQKKENDATISALTSRFESLKQELTHIATSLQSGSSALTFEKAIGSSDCAAVTFNHEVNIVNISVTALTLIGKPKEQLLLKPVQELFISPSGSGGIHNASVGDTFISNKTHEVLGEIITVSGNKPVTGYLIPYHQDSIPFVVFLFVDGSKKMTEEEEKKQIEAKLTSVSRVYDTVRLESSIAQEIVRFIPMACVALNTDGSLAWLNPMAQSLLGTNETELIGKQYTDVIRLVGTDGKAKTQTIADAYAQKTAVLPTWTFLLTHKGNIPIMGAATPLPEGKVLLIFANATERYEKESDEKAFFSGAAHDLRTPITAIRGFLDLAMEGLGKQPEEKITLLLSEAHISVLHLVGLVNDLLSVSRIDMGRIQIVREPFDIAALAKEVVESNKLVAQNKNLFLRQEINEVNIPKALGDKGKTKEIIENLVSNAIKYTTRGGIVLSHRVENARVITTITDTGGGISPQNKRLLFRKFQQVGIARNQPLAKSTGLGLFISKTFAVMMGGDITLESSELEKGSTFALSLPIAIQQA